MPGSTPENEIGRTLASEQQLVKDSVQESEKRYRALVEHSLGLICTHNLEGRLLSVNPAGAAGLGYRPEEMVGKKMGDFLVPAARHLFQNYLEQIKREKYSTGLMHLLNQRGEVRIWMYCNVLYDNDEGPAYVLGHAQDITEFKHAEQSLRKAYEALERRVELRTQELSAANRELEGEVAERKRTEEALRESETRFRLLAENAQDIIYLYRLKPTPGFEYVSPSATAITGYTPEEHYANPQLGFEMVLPEDRPSLMNLFQATEAQDSALTLRWMRKDGRIIWTEQRNRLIYDDAGNVIAIEGIARDVTERKVAEAISRESESRFRAVFDNTAIGITLADAQGRFIEANPAMQRLLGYTDEELRRKTFAEVTVKEDIEVNLALARELFEGKRDSYQLEKRYIRKDGQIVWGHLVVSAIEQNGTRFSVGILEDITERKLAEERLKQSETYYRTLFEQAHDAIIIFEPEGERVLDVNPGACEMYGFTREEFIGMSLLNVTQDTTHCNQHITETLSSETLYNFESIHRRKDGTPMFLEINASVLDYQNKRVILTINRNITDRKRAEILEARQRQFLEMIATGNPLPKLMDYLTHFVEAQAVEAVCAVLLLDQDKESLRLGASPSMPESLRHAVDDLHLSITDDPYSAAVLRKKPIIISDISADPVCEKFKALAREHGLQSCTSVPILGTNDEVFGALALFYEQPNKQNPDDIKLLQISSQLLSIAIEREQAQESLRSSEEQLRQSQKMEAVGRLAGGIAHDFNNLLATIMLQCDLMLLKFKEDDPSRRRVEGIRKSTERAASLTRQLLAFGRRQVLQPVLLNLNMVVEELSKLLHRTIGEDIDLQTQLDPALDEIKADPGQIEQVILNMAVNARDAMPDGGTLTIQTKNVRVHSDEQIMWLNLIPGPYVLLAVTDTGIGMDEATKQRIFEPFFTTKEFGKGTGLGLSVIDGIVAQSGGGIFVETEPGKGTTFKIFLPSARSQEKARGSNDRGASLGDLPKGSETILLVEDEEMLRSATKEILEISGYTLLEARNGLEALEICKTHHSKIHLVLSDVVMPQMGGREMVERMKDECYGFKVIYMSGHTDDEVIRRGAAGADAEFLKKPFTPEELIRKVRVVLDRGAEKE
jgi:PAS domain S-box-containing protein